MSLKKVAFLLDKMREIIDYGMMTRFRHGMTIGQDLGLTLIYHK